MRALVRARDSNARLHRGGWNRSSAGGKYQAGATGRPLVALHSTFYRCTNYKHNAFHVLEVTILEITVISSAVITVEIYWHES